MPCDLLVSLLIANLVIVLAFPVLLVRSYLMFKEIKLLLHRWLNAKATTELDSRVNIDRPRS